MINKKSLKSHLLRRVGIYRRVRLRISGVQTCLKTIAYTARKQSVFTNASKIHKRHKRLMQSALELTQHIELVNKLKRKWMKSSKESKCSNVSRRSPNWPKLEETSSALTTSSNSQENSFTIMLVASLLDTFARLKD